MAVSEELGQDSHSHVAEGDLSQQYEAYRVRLGGVTVVGTLGHHVSKVHTFAEHVTSLEEIKQNQLETLRNTVELE